MSTLRVDNIKSRTGTAVTIPSGQSLDVTGDVNVTGGLEVSGASNFNTTGIITAGQFRTTAGIGVTENIVSGVITATTFKGALVGNVTGDVTGNTSGTAGNLTGTPNITVGNISAAAGDLTIRNVTGVAATFTGVLTYEDVTNVDSVGVVTARSGIEFGAAGVGGTITALGHAEFAGIATATQFVGILTGGTASGATVGVGTTSTILGVTDGATQNRFSGILAETAAIQATNVTSGSIDLAQGNVHYFTSNGSGATAAAIKYKGGNNLSAYMKVGENISVSIISKPNNSEYISSVTIDGGAVTEEWLGGSTPAAASGAASSYTITNINITRFAATGTPNSDYLVLVGVNNYA